MTGRGWLALVALAGVAAGSTVPVRRLEVTEGGTDRPVYGRGIRVGETFELRYVHSVEHFPVTGRFRVEPDGRLRVTETRFARFGAGLPDLGLDVKYDRGSGEFRQKDPGVVLDELALRVHSFTRHELRHAGLVVPLSARVPEGALVRIRAVKRPAWEVWRGMVFPRQDGRGAGEHGTALVSAREDRHEPR